MGRVREDPMRELSSLLERNGISPSSMRPIECSRDDICLLTVPGEEAVPRWRHLRTLVEETGRYPVILGSNEDLERHAENLELYDLELCEDESEGSQLGEILHAAKGFDFVRWAQERTH